MTLGRRLACVVGKPFWRNEIRIEALQKKTSTEYWLRANPVASTSCEA
jgi:hypothetical protein